ncbi:thermonuclease family protein [Wielerella bovis]|uniref:thermonuclease family protein n=1 Tax=Wielerella bovis TaxID=2917790 RepID=UPI0020193F41|nr:thermonuclease family protein [Wielerella bovis]ULJ65070.1 thermonuclease family protein [Wielerella bovis]ULJ67343.1 thermonuclease family protein [Wielerella bovis]
MKKLWILLAMCLSIAHATAKNIPIPHSYTATVTHIHDGDTIRVLDEHGQKQRIRLAYIDAPEVSPAQAHGIASRDALRQLLTRQTVRIDVWDIDRYGRQVARVMLDNQDINLTQIQTGNAWHYRSIARKNQHQQDYEYYQAAENQAKSARLGLWRKRNPVAPWHFRQQNRQVK